MAKKIHVHMRECLLTAIQPMTGHHGYPKPARISTAAEERAREYLRERVCTGSEGI